MLHRHGTFNAIDELIQSWRDVLPTCPIFVIESLFCPEIDLKQAILNDIHPNLTASNITYQVNLNGTRNEAITLDERGFHFNEQIYESLAILLANETKWYSSLLEGAVTAKLISSTLIEK